MSSIRLRLLLPLMGLFILSWGLIAALTRWQAQHEAEEVYDAQLAQASHILLGLAMHEMSERREELARRPVEQDFSEEVEELERLFLEHKYAPKLEFQMWQEGRLVMHSSGMPHFPHAGPGGYDHRVVAGETWRIYTTQPPDADLLVRVAEREGVRQGMIDEITRQVSVPMIAAMPLLAFIIWFGVGRALRPLGQLAHEVAQRSSEQLEPIDHHDRVPDEVRPLVRALDDLLGRLSAAFERERRFTADASHELRTPLASLKTQAQVALRSRDDGERRRALEQILAGVDRATHLVEQLLTLARLDPSQGRNELRPLELGAVLEEGLAQCVPAALEKGIELALNGEADGRIEGNPGALAILLRNLVDNAVRYTPEGGTVEVGRRREGEVLLVTVDDSGPGIPADERERVFERFHRGLGHRVQGCGLGLSIVERIVQLHHARIRLTDSPLGGLRVEVGFPSPGDPISHVAK